MAEIKWIKISTNIFDDEKIKLIEKLPEGDTILIIWIKLLVLAGRCNQCGLIYIARDIPYDESTLTTILNRPSATVKLALETFIRFGMIEIMNDKLAIINWEKHQNLDGLELVREQNRIRKQKQRERVKLLSCHVTSRDESRKVTQENKIKNKNKSINGEKAPFTPPTLAEVQAYVTEKNLNINAVYFFEFYDEGNWHDTKGNPVKNWKQKAITWHRKNEEKTSGSYEDDKRKHYGNSHLL
jgi:predicted phage replisome organizer